MKQEKRSFRKHQLIIFAILIIIILAVATYLFTRSAGPKDIGKFQYVGKSESGCYFFCSQLPNVDYYFATDMARKESVAYITKYADVEEISENYGYSDGTYKSIDFRSKNGEEFYLIFYDALASKSVSSYYKLENTSRPYIVLVNGNPREKRNNLSILKDTIK